jgi:hypothetical protein
MHNGRIVGYAEAVILTDVEFRVRESGRQRVLRERRKNVHAFVVGSCELSAMGYEQDKNNNFVFPTHGSSPASAVPMNGFGLFDLDNNPQCRRRDWTWLTAHSSQLSYNPYKFGHFYDKATEAPVYKGKRVLVTANNGIYLENEE